MPGPTLTRRRLVTAASAGAALSALPVAAISALPAETPARPAWKAATPGAALPVPPLETLVVNRITFGLAPADLARARSIGADRFIAEQLEPESIADTAVDTLIRQSFPTLRLGNTALLTREKREVVLDLKAATVLRALASKRQLFELMVDFWSNHFNVYHLDGPVAYFKTVDDRDVIRHHALGRFRDLLGASAQSPAMLSYLDNATNTKDGPNENYARELMELHTVSVGGGYTQEDVQEVAKAFTGWRISRRNGPVGFHFDASKHDDGARLVLGQSLPAGLGQEHGERVLDILAAHPKTASFIALKLCRRFVADNPPAALVEAAAATFTATGGDIRQVMRTILTSAQFRAGADQKLKRPFEGVVAMLRVLGAQVTEPLPAGRAINAALKLLGQVPFDWHPPNGYPDVAAAWANTNGLLNRWNLGLTLGYGKLPGLRTDVMKLAAGVPGAPQPTAGNLVDHLSRQIVARPLVAADRNHLVAFAADGGPSTTRLNPAKQKAKVPGLVALLFDSPYFQWR